MNTKTYEVHTCDFYSSLILKNKQKGMPKKIINVNVLRWDV